MATITLVDRAAPTSVNTTSSPQADAKARAISMLLGNNNTQNGVQNQQLNQSKISQEEIFSASPAREETRQLDNTETEDTTSTEEVTPPKQELLSTQHAILARKEKAFRAKVVAQEQTIRAREAQLLAKESEISSKSTQDLSNYISKDKLKQNAYSVLEELGISYDDISQQALSAQTPEAQSMQRMRDELKEELRQVREEQANARKTFETQQTESYKQAINQIKTEVTELVNADPNFETIKATRSVNDVVDLIERTFKEDGTLLTVEQAAQAIEDYLVEEVEKISKIKKIQDRLKPAQQVAKQYAQNTQRQQQAGDNQIKTLTNSMTNTKPLSARERAIMAMKGQLNK